jgi:hypothetical protein
VKRGPAVKEIKDNPRGPPFTLPGDLGAAAIHVEATGLAWARIGTQITVVDRDLDRRSNGRGFVSLVCVGRFSGAEVFCAEAAMGNNAQQRSSVQNFACLASPIA